MYGILKLIALSYCRFLITGALLAFLGRIGLPVLPLKIKFEQYSFKASLDLSFLFEFVLSLVSWKIALSSAVRPLLLS